MAATDSIAPIRRFKLPAEMRPEWAPAAVVDTREQNALCLDPLRIEVDTLNCGDYSLRGLEHLVRIERKADDLLSCCGTDREMFMSQMVRLRAFPTRALVLEWSWQQIEAGGWRSKVTPQSVLGTLLGIVADGIPVICAGSHERAGQYVSRLLFTVARREWRKLRTLAENIEMELAS